MRGGRGGEEECFRAGEPGSKLYSVEMAQDLMGWKAAGVEFRRRCNSIFHGSKYTGEMVQGS